MEKGRGPEKTSPRVRYAEPLGNPIGLVAAIQPPAKKMAVQQRLCVVFREDANRPWARCTVPMACPQRKHGLLSRKNQDEPGMRSDG